MARYTPPSLRACPTLHDLADQVTALYPDRPYFRYTEDDSPDTIIPISNLEVNRASHRAATAFSELPGYNPASRETVAVIIAADTLVYYAVFLGALRAGFVPFFISPRNPVLVLVDLISKTGCTRVLATPTLGPLCQKVASEACATGTYDQAKNPLRVDFIPTLATLYPYLARESFDHPFRPFFKTIAAARPDDVYLYLHSSGSTGFPKPIPHTRKTMASWCNRDYLRSWSTHSPPFCLAGLGIPMFHTLGVCAYITTPMMAGSCLAIFPPIVKTPEAMPYAATLESMLTHSKRAKCTAMIAVPSQVQEWGQSEENLAYLKTLRFVLYAGGAMVPKVGDFISEAGVKLVCVYGATELGCVSNLEVISERLHRGWMYTQFDSGLAVKWVDQEDGNGTAAVQFMANDDHIPAVLNVPGEKGFATSDIFTPHPTEPKLWKSVGRIDSVIVLVTGYKVAPGPMEDVIGAHRYVQGVIMFGNSRLTVGVLIEPRQATLEALGEDASRKLADELWPTIEEANAVAPDFAQISRDMVIVTTPEKPLPRAPKGTVMTKAALREYEAEIDAL
ncbi:hypothetical protein BDV98DRAFT_619597 [Pterulicium gracile]|uniref:AMP-dependent synthetase/ligase domain-containing protein n=1 Tax=Pterulicium gracile TaxID=1884261 RepID=A0A5C3QLX7_9AGAR|nr:hypothetical protein BDV98DRAFT_619597 [Pterula gracilis]